MVDPWSHLFNIQPTLNPPPSFDIITEISWSWRIPDHQQGVRCKAARSDD